MNRPPIYMILRGSPARPESNLDGRMANRPVLRRSSSCASANASPYGDGKCKKPLLCPRFLKLKICQALHGRRRSSRTAAGVTLITRTLMALSLRSNETDDSSDDFRGSIGLTPLYTPSEPILDLFFVHGLRAGSRKT